MSSPFSSSVNARLVFRVPGAGLVIDSRGNPAPEVTLTALAALLIPGKPSANVKAGIDEISEYFQGYLVDPEEMPIGILPLMEAEAEIKTSSRVIEKGIFRLLPKSQNPFVVAAGVRGVYEIAGILRRM